MIFNKNKICVIAEAGVNHNGNVLLAKKLVEIAKNSGANYIKFQYFNPEFLSTYFAKQAIYQKRSFKQKNNSQKEMLKKLSLSFEQLKIIDSYCKKKKIKLALSVFDHISLKKLIKFNLDFIKIPSGEITNFPLLKDVAKLKKKIILSTGMCNIKEIQSALNVLKKFKLPMKKVTLMHCTTNYPTSDEEVNISAIIQMKKKFNLEVGYSDHSIGNEASCAAAILGSRIFEKHFTISKKMKGPDHLASLEPNELRNYITSIKRTVKIIGNGKKNRTSKEQKNLKIVRKSIYALKNIKKGELITENNIITKRPFNKNNPMKWEKIIGKKSKKNYVIDEEI